MSEQIRHFYEFGDYRIEKTERLLTRRGEVVPLPPKAVELLFVLLENNNHVVNKEELMERVWADSFVEEANISRTVFLLRKVFGENVGERFIETIPRRGYRFAAHVAETNGEEVIEITAHERTRSHIVFEETFEVEKTVPRPPDYRLLPKVELINSKIQITPAVTPNNLFAQTTALIGREQEIAEIKNLLSREDVRLLTLTGVGGTGKTTLAKAVAREMFTKFEDGAVFVELAGITNPELVVSAVARTLGMKETGNKPILEVLKDYLRDKRILLVVDNFEQVLPAAPMLAELTRAVPRSKILVTSRIRLQISADFEFIVPRLAVPENSAQLSDGEAANYEAVRLFVGRAKAIKPGFALTEKNLSTVAEICRRLDGLPLAIELAAARIRIISPQSILERLENPLKLLVSGETDLPAHQQTVYRTIEWSYDLLGEDEKRLFCCLAVFAGGFTIKAAEAFCGDPTLRLEVLDIITSLIDNSLLVQKDQFDDESRFRMLEVVREYALEILESDKNLAEAMRCGHAAYFLRLGEEAELFLQTAQAGEWLDRLEEEHDNLRAAFDWLFKNDLEKGALLAAAIRVYLINRSHLAEGREWLTRALERSHELPSTVRFKLLHGLGFLAIVQGDYEAARKFFEEDLAEGRKAGDKKRTAESLRGLAGALHGKGDYTAARTLQEEGLAIHRELNDKFGIAKSLNGLGSLAFTEGDTATARRLMEESLTIFRQLGNESGICYCLLNLGEVAYNSGDYIAARDYYRQVVTIAQNIGYKDRISFCLDAFAAIAAVRKEWKMAAQLAGAAEQLRKSIGCGEDSSDRDFRHKYLEKVRGALGETAFSAAEEQGRKLRLDEAIKLALFTE